MSLDIRVWSGNIRAMDPFFALYLLLTLAFLALMFIAYTLVGTVKRLVDALLAVRSPGALYETAAAHAVESGRDEKRPAIADVRNLSEVRPGWSKANALDFPEGEA